MRTSKSIFLKAAVVSLLCLCSAGGSATPASTSTASEAESTLTFPKASWAATPAGTLSKSCKESLASVRTDLKLLPTTALLAVQGGRVLMSYGKVETVSYVASIRKSILAMLYGKYVADGSIDLDRTIGDIGIDEPDGLLPIEREAKLRDLITARSGVYHRASNAGDSTESAPPRGSVKPGTYFLYNNWDFNAAGGAFELLTKQSIYKAFANDLAKPLQFQDFKLKDQELSGDSSRSKYLAYHFWLSTRDMARIGHLMLAQGRWGERQVLSRDWVDKMLQPATRSADMHPLWMASQKQSYGYMWWLMEEPETSVLAGAYSAQGAFGQYILVVPKRQMVIAHKVKVSDNQPPRGEIPWRRFLELARKVAEAPCP